MKTIKKLGAVLILTALLAALCSCGTTSNGKTESGSGSKSVESGEPAADEVNEDFFEWNGNLISGLTAAGAEQTTLVIPARCEGFDGMPFYESIVEFVSFEGTAVTDLGYAFAGASALKGIELPESLASIGDMSMCTSLENITLPASVVSIGAYAFSGCSSLQSVVFEGTALSEIPQNCFEYCSALTEVTIPAGVTSIREYAFSQCDTLSVLNLPATVETIEKNAFTGTAIDTLTLPDGMENLTLADSAFGTNAYYMTVYIPEGSWLDTNRDSWDIGFKSIVA